MRARHLANSIIASLKDSPVVFIRGARQTGKSTLVRMIFVGLELLKQRGWSRAKPNVFHFRSHNGEEVDIVLEDAAGRIVGIEVKATASINAGHFKGLRALAEASGGRFVRGVALYTGTAAVPFGPNLTALPITSLWSGWKD